MLLLFCMILFLLCAALFLYILALKKSMKKMSHELENTKAADYNRQLTVALFDKELTQLATQFNHNLDYQTQLKNEAQKSELSLRQSISDIAHDLRTPLTVIRGNLQMLDSANALSEKDSERLYVCRSKADELGSMVDDFFEMSVLESDSSKVPLEKVNLTNFLMQFVIDHETYIRGRGLTPDIRLSEQTIWIKADTRLLSRMLENLLTNVVKYAKDNFRLTVELSDDNKCRISFSNAIPKEHPLDDPARLFERSYRGSRARSGGGAGLGLYIVKLLAQKQDAEVGARIEDGQLHICVTFETAEAG